MLDKLGIIAGRGSLPSEIANIYKTQGGECFIVAITNEANLELIQEYPFKSFSLGQVGNIFKYFSDKGVTKILLIGKVDRPNFSNIKVDLKGSILLSKILKQKFLGDDKVLKIIAEFIENNGFKIISPLEILQNTNYELDDSNNLSKQDLIDINLGKQILQALGSLDVGQSVIVYKGYVLGIEAAEGTNNLIKRCAALRKSETGGILIKMTKSHQDLRLDLPTIGSDTIKNLNNHRFKGIMIDEKVIIVNPRETLNLARKHKLFVTMLKSNL